MSHVLSMSVRVSIITAALTVLCAATSASAQQKQVVSYKVTAQNSSYTQRNALDVGDEAGHQVILFEIHRTFPSNPPVINGLKLKETWTRGYADYADFNGLSINYTIYVFDNGDKFYAMSRTMGQADTGGRRSTISVGELRGGTGKFVGVKGLVKSKGASEGKANFNETQSEIEFWF